MATITYAYIPNDVVFHVPEELDACDGVREAIVRAVKINHRTTGITIEYDVAFVRFPGSAATTVEANLFPDVDTALAEYRIRLTT